jgi:hypothetical protein
VWAVGEKSEGDKVVYGAGSFSRHATLSIRMTRCVIYPRVRLSFSFPLTLFIDLARSNARINVLVKTKSVITPDILFGTYADLDQTI